MLNEDVALIAAIVGSMAAGILLPAAGKLIEPYILLWLGALLFLNLLRLNLSDLVAVFKTPRQLVVLSIIKLGVLPVGMYAHAYIIYEPFALPILLLSGVSTGLGALLRYKSHRRTAFTCNRHDNYHLNCSSLRTAIDCLCIC